MFVTEREAYQLLASAIVLQAVKDYRFAIKARDGSEQERLEYWFRKSWCKTLSGLEPKTIIWAAREGADWCGECRLDLLSYINMHKRTSQQKDEMK